MQINNKRKVVSLLIQLWGKINSARKKQFILTALLIVVVSFAEIISIGAVVPFLGIIITPEKVFIEPALVPVFEFLEIKRADDILLPATIVFCIAALLAGMLRLLLLWVSMRISFGAGVDLGVDIYYRTLKQGYHIHVNRRSSDVIDGITNKTASLTRILMMVVMMISSAVMLAVISVVLLKINTIGFISMITGFSLIYILIIFSTKSKLIAYSTITARESPLMIKSLQEGLGGIRDIILDGSQRVFCDVFKKSSLRLRRAQANSAFIGGSPRYAMESIGVALIACLSYYLSIGDGGIYDSLPVLGALALGAQRTLPLLQQIYGSWTGILASKSSLEESLELLNQHVDSLVESAKETDPIKFSESISLDTVSYSYNLSSGMVIDNVSLEIAKGERIGIIGKTGSGKSTLVDILMGLLKPVNGTLSIDGVPITEKNCNSWMSSITHVPQSIFITDSSIEENIAFGVNRKYIDRDRVQYAAKVACLDDVINNLPNRYETLVGEGGGFLSGGQRQRLGIARAIYKGLDVYFFDEATSSLDEETEMHVMESLNSLDKSVTMFIISHRMSSLALCDKVIRLEKGKIVWCGSHLELIKSNSIDKQ